jgi:lysyl-tRNA synthetase class 2
MASIEEIRAERAEKAKKLQEQGINPYPADSKRDSTIAKLLEDFSDLAENKKMVTIAGRILSSRGHGGSTFIDLYDGTGKMQGFLKKDELAEGQYALFADMADASDFIEITGTAYVTNKGQQSILATSWRMLTKSLRPIPDAWYGLKDEDERYRLRYLDILINEEVRDIVYKRSIFWNTIRTYLLGKEFVEVETPVLENTTGGADAQPFITHHNALDIDVYLRISAGELWQKKLLVAGIPKTFEIGRIFRNEGISNEHLQDYTQLEYYMAYADYYQGMEMTKELYRLIAEKTFGTKKFTIRGHEVDFDKEWEVYDYVKVLQDAYGIDALNVTVEEIEAQLVKHEIAYDKKMISIERGVDLLWKKIRKSLAGPGFLINVPVYLESLAKRSRTNSEVVERFQVIIAGSEMGKGYSELNDPIDQGERFARQQALRDAGDEEAQMADMEFVKALEYGMPPAFGFGLSERLFSFLMDKSVREAQIFPLLRPRE